MVALIPEWGYSLYMGNLTRTEKSYNGHSVEDLSDLSCINADVLAVKLENPRLFTLSEVSELAPHLGYTPEAYVAEVLS